MSYASDKARWLREFRHDWKKNGGSASPDTEASALKLAAGGCRPCDAVGKLLRNPGAAWHDQKAWQADATSRVVKTKKQRDYWQARRVAELEAVKESEEQAMPNPGRRRNPLMMIMENPGAAWHEQEFVKANRVYSTTSNKLMRARLGGIMDAHEAAIGEERVMKEFGVGPAMTENPGRRRNPFWRDSYRHVEYHSPEWAALVEQGWTTMTVDGGVATMIRQEDSYGQRARNPQQAFDVYLRGRKIDTVFYGANTKVDTEEVRRSLVNHDGYDPGIKVVRRREGLRRNPGLSGTASSFQATLARLARIAGTTAEQVYEYWREYSRDCQSYDQSPVLSEFVAWYKGKLGGNEVALRDAVQE